MSRVPPYVVALDAAPDSQRERKKARTRDDLIRAAFQLFDERGYDATTVEDIASAAGVSPRTFFRYFGNKEEVVFHTKDQYLAKTLATLAARPAEESPFDALRHTVLEHLENYSANPPLQLFRVRLITEAWHVGSYGLQVQQRWVQMLAAQLARRMGVDLRSDLRPVLYAGCAIMVMRTALQLWARSQGTADLGALATAAFEELRNGMRS